MAPIAIVNVLDKSPNRKSPACRMICFHNVIHEPPSSTRYTPNLLKKMEIAWQLNCDETFHKHGECTHLALRGHLHKQ